MVGIDLSNIETIIRQEVSDKIKSELQGIDLAGPMRDMLSEMMDAKVQSTVNGMINSAIKDGSLVSLVKAHLDMLIQQKLDDMVRSRISSMVSNVDVGTEISQKIADFVTNKMQHSDLPDGLISANALDLSGFEISGDNVSGGSIRDFSSTGIQDISSRLELTVMDGAVVVESDLVANHLRINGEADFTDINVKGNIRLDGDLIFSKPNFSEQIISLVETRLNSEKDRVIDVGGNEILTNGKTLIGPNSLGPSVAFSNLRKLGNLQELKVIGEMVVADTLHVIDEKVGINTDSPAGALTVWDQDAELTMRKHSSRTTFLGTTRDCDLILGTNGNGVLGIGRDGTVAVDKITINGIKISVSDSVPEGIGSPGEIVIMSRVNADLPWAYQCLSGSTWAALQR